MNINKVLVLVTATASLTAGAQVTLNDKNANAYNLGYGVEISDFFSTAAATTITGEELQQTSATNLAQALYGRLPALTALSQGGFSGDEGKGASFNIRGYHTLNDKDILILVDAYEYRADGKTFKEKHPGSVNVTAENPYEGLDPRFELTVVKNGDMWPSNATQQQTIQTYHGGFNGAPKYGATPTGYYLKKFVDGSCVTAANNSTTTRHNWIVMRLAEVYLNYAEAMYNYYGSADAAGDFGMSANEAVNVLRNREDIMMPEFHGDADFEERYMRERMVELAFEGHRFWDVRRWKKGADCFSRVEVADLRLDANGDLILTRTTKPRQWNDKYNLYPIPQSEIQKNGKLKQNPDW